ncbi:MAG: flippase-like domain-containing protein, partial [Bdellovibrionales bacterium]|nr:flippase-like domain-containing protein [Bdellovibrionales bacterium]
GWIVGPKLVGIVFSEQSKIGSRLTKLSGMLTRDTKTLVLVTLLSVAFHLLQMWLHWMIAQALGAPIPFVYILTTVPFINILGSLPISWNGVGVREAGYIFFFAQQHPFFTQEQAIAMGAMWLLAITVTSAVGGTIAMLSKDFSFSILKAPAYQN